MPAPAVSIRTYADIAASFGLWGEYVDPDMTFSEEEFEAMSFEQRIALMVETFGPEPTDAEISEDIGFTL
jgi:hypothetical protein